jgi:hypothetical protein
MKAFGSRLKQWLLTSVLLAVLSCYAIWVLVFIFRNRIIAYDFRNFTAVILTNSMELEKLIVIQLVRKFSAEGWLPCSQESATGSYPKPGASSPQLPPCFAKIHSDIILPPTSRSSEWSLPLKFSDQNVICFNHLSYACYISANLILLDLIALMILG